MLILQGKNHRGKSGYQGSQYSRPAVRKKPAAEFSSAALPPEARVAVTPAGNPNIVSRVVMPAPT